MASASFYCGNDSVHIVLFNGPVHDKIRTIPDLIGGKTNMTHMHITSWVIALILVFVAYGLYSSGNSKGAKITHMILRLFYIIVIITGAQLFLMFTAWNGEYIAKALLGLITIGFMEMLLIRRKNGKAATGIWIGFIVVLLLTVALGLRLPLGFKVF